jgi:hypothetical protein
MADWGQREGMTPVLIPTPRDFVKVIEGRFGI